MSNEEVKLDSVELDKKILEIEDLPGTLSGLICPDCGGPLWEMRKDSVRRFQCHVGHAFLAESFLESQAEEIEHLLWSTLRVLKERAMIASQMANEAREQNDPLRTERFENQAQQALQGAELIRQILLIGRGNSTPDSALS